jgi:hypothetical protein
MSSPTRRPSCAHRCSPVLDDRNGRPAIQFSINSQLTESDSCDFGIRRDFAAASPARPYKAGVGIRMRRCKVFSGFRKPPKPVGAPGSVRPGQWLRVSRQTSAPCRRILATATRPTQVIARSAEILRSLSLPAAAGTERGRPRQQGRRSARRGGDKPQLAASLLSCTRRS